MQQAKYELLNRSIEKTGATHWRDVFKSTLLPVDRYPHVKIVANSMKNIQTKTQQQAYWSSSYILSVNNFLER